MKYDLICRIKNKVFQKKDKTRSYISVKLQREINKAQRKMASEYKKRNKKKAHFNTFMASDYIAEIVRDKLK